MSGQLYNKPEKKNPKKKEEKNTLGKYSEMFTTKKEVFFVNSLIIL